MKTRSQQLQHLARKNMDEWAKVSSDPGLFHALAISQLREAGLHEEADQIPVLPIRHRVTRTLPTVPSSGTMPRNLRVKSPREMPCRVVTVKANGLPDGVTMAHQRWNAGPWELTGPLSDAPIAVWEDAAMQEFLQANATMEQPPLTKNDEI